MPTFDGYFIENGTQQEAVHGRLSEIFGPDIDEAGSPIDWGVETVRTWALRYVRQIAAEKEDEIDKFFTTSPAKAMFINNEMIAYQDAGRPADPNPNIYKMANSIATQRGIPLRAVLEALRTRWLAMWDRIATLGTELDRVEDAINAASTVAEIETILAGLNYG